MSSCGARFRCAIAAQDLLLGIEDPARYAAMALPRALEERGIAVEGEAGVGAPVSRRGGGPDGRAAAAPPTGIELARRVSAPLIEDLRITDKVSQNLHAELALRAVAGRGGTSAASRPGWRR